MRLLRCRQALYYLSLQETIRAESTLKNMYKVVVCVIGTICLDFPSNKAKLFFVFPCNRFYNTIFPLFVHQIEEQSCLLVPNYCLNLSFHFYMLSFLSITFFVLFFFVYCFLFSFFRFLSKCVVILLIFPSYIS